MMTNNVTGENLSVSKKIKNKVLWRWIFTSSVSSNYEKMQALAYCYAMLPFLRQIHKQDPDGLNEAVRNHLQFFNTNPWIAPYVLGVNIGTEEIEKNNAKQAVAGIKTGLMGPLAGLGDSLFVVIPWTIFGAIAANMALQGSFIGILLWIMVSILLKALSFPFFSAGYQSGTRLVSALETKMKIISSGVSVLGLMVVGALIPSVVKVNVALSFHQGNVTMKGQDILDQIMPGIIPAALVFAVWFLLNKNIKPVYTIFIIIALSVLLHVFGILK